jgi:cytochrome c oxidase cbb3-type subunit 3/ubiquinol-cytochrome c reductase cytochrome c subunit
VGLDPTYVAQGDAARGEAIYTKHCASCHGPNGLPGRDPSLVGTAIGNAVFLEQASAAFLVYAIAHGRTGTVMQAFSDVEGGPLSDQDIEDVVTYMRSWQK